MTYTPIVPALIPASAQAVRDAAQQLVFSHEFHLDVVDGEFVSSTSWPHDPAGEPLAVKSFLDSYTLEVDLMVKNPFVAAGQWVTAGADMLVFHVESAPLEAFRNFTEEASVSVGVSFSGDTTMETFEPYLQYADYIQLMGIAEIGAQGQPFDEAVFDKISYLKQQYPNLSITVDGSVNSTTIQRLKEAGVDRFIVGSAIVKQPDPAAAYSELQSLIND